MAAWDRSGRRQSRSCRWTRGTAPRSSSWSHNYPSEDFHLPQILDDLTTIDVTHPVVQVFLGRQKLDVSYIVYGLTR